MSPLRRPGREEIAAGVIALSLAAAGLAFWLRRDARTGDADAPPAHALDEPLPADPATRVGRLSNGMRYVVRANRWPHQQAELRLVVDAGSVLEAEDQRGLAHAVEHMVFRGTRHFPRRTIENYLQSIGLLSGEDLNAYTTPDETVYDITIPTDRPAVVDSAVTMLAEMAHDATFDSAEARTEGGIVLAEWRSRRDAGDRLTEIRDSTLLAYSRYARRRPIGDTAVIRRFDTRAMRRFYEDWYRPELMSIVAVGDFDARTMERLVRKRFGAIPASAEPRTRPAVSAPRVHAVRAVALTDPEARGVRLALWFPRASRARRLVADYRRSLVETLWRDVLEARLQDAADEPGSPLLSAGVVRQNVVRPVDAEVVSAAVVDGRAPEALDRLIAEMRRLARHGPTQRELARLGRQLIGRRAEAAQWSESSDDLADAYVDEFLGGTVPVDRDLDLALAREVVPTIDTAEVRRMAASVTFDSGAFVVATGPSARELADVAPAVLVARARAAAAREVPGVAEAPDSVDLVADPPLPGRIASERFLPEISGFEWTLANGMRVILKPTDFVDEQLEFRLVGSGGASVASDDDYASAYLADGIVRSTGVGALTGRQLRRLVDASSIELTQSVDDDRLELSGYGSPREAELLFQLLYLHLAAVRADSSAYRRYVERMRSYAAHRGADPDEVFADSVAAVLGDHHRRALHAGAGFYSQVDLQRALGFWRARTANASSYTLVLVGDFTLDLVRPLVARYLASLPAGTPELPRDEGIRAPAGVVRRELHFGEGPKARTRIVISGAFDDDLASREAFGVATDVAQLALEDELRETLGGTYGVSVQSSVVEIPPAQYRLAVDFEAAPERIDSLADAALAVLERLRTSGPTSSEFEKVRAARVRRLDASLDDNDYWATELSSHARRGWPLASINDHADAAKRLSELGARTACARFLATGHYVRVTMYPPSAKRAPSLAATR
jgi:zinc protease